MRRGTFHVLIQRTVTAGKVLSRTKVHINIGHQTSMAQPIFFGVPPEEGLSPEALLANTCQHVGKFADPGAVFDAARPYVAQDQLYSFMGTPHRCTPTYECLFGVQLPVEVLINAPRYYHHW